jgi:hypothetical protein
LQLHTHISWCMVGKMHCKLPTRHQLMHMCSAMGTKMASGYENDEFLSQEKESSYNDSF